MSAPPPPGAPAPVVTPDPVCAVHKLDEILEALQRHRQTLIDLEGLEEAGLVPKPSRDIRASIEHRIRAILAQLDGWTAQE